MHKLGKPVYLNQILVTEQNAQKQLFTYILQIGVLKNFATFTG